MVSPTTSWRFFAGDLNGDGLDDAIGGQDSLFWWENPGNPGWEWQKRLVEKINLMAGDVLDYDGDNESDIVCFQNDYANDEGKLLLYRNLGNGLFWEKSVLYVHELAGGSGSSEMTTGVHHKRWVPVVWQYYWPGAIRMINILRDGPSGWYTYKVVSPPYTLTTTYFPSFVDLDNDGVADLWLEARGTTTAASAGTRDPNSTPTTTLKPMTTSMASHHRLRQRRRHGHHLPGREQRGDVREHPKPPGEVRAEGADGVPV